LPTRSKIENEDEDDDEDDWRGAYTALNTNCSEAEPQEPIEEPTSAEGARRDALQMATSIPNVISSRAFSA
jgi:hypothetical protein